MRVKVEIIRNFMVKYGIKKHKLGILCNLSRRSVEKALTNSKNTTLEALYQIAKFMNLKVSDIIEE